MIYSGQEFAIKELPDLFNPDPINWEAGNNLFAEFLTKLIELSKRIKSSPERFEITHPKDGYVCIEWNNETKFRIFLNLNPGLGHLKVHEKIKGTDLLSGKALSLKYGELINKFPLLLELE